MIKISPTLLPFYCNDMQINSQHCIALEVNGITRINNVNNKNG